MKQKPIILEIDEAKRELADCVNDILQQHGLSCYLMEPVFAEMYSQIKTCAQNEIAQVRAQMGAAESAPQE